MKESQVKKKRKSAGPEHFYGSRNLPKGQNAEPRRRSKQRLITRHSRKFADRPNHFSLTVAKKSPHYKPFCTPKHLSFYWHSFIPKPATSPPPPGNMVPPRKDSRHLRQINQINWQERRHFLGGRASGTYHNASPPISFLRDLATGACHKSSKLPAYDTTRLNQGPRRATNELLQIKNKKILLWSQPQVETKTAHMKHLRVKFHFSGNDKNSPGITSVVRIRTNRFIHPQSTSSSLPIAGARVDRR